MKNTNRLFFAMLMIMASFLFAASVVTLSGQTPDIEVSPFPSYEGAVIHFDAVGFDFTQLKWDFGDGTNKRGGQRESHVYRHPGNYKISVFEPGNLSKALLVKRVKVLKDDRRIILANGDMVFKGQEIQVKGERFTGPLIKWRFGDGTSKTTGSTVTHAFNKTGTLKIEAVDMGGKGTKTIVKKIQVKKDNRILERPEKILAGEPVDLGLKNTPRKDWAWEFSNGRKQRGPVIKGWIFDNPGNIRVTVTDPNGLFPPLTETIRVSKDNREIKTDTPFALPGEDIGIKALNFRGREIKWDFGDGTVKTIPNRKGWLKHSYKENGNFRITARDNGGNSPKTFSTDVRISELSPRFQLTIAEMSFEDGKYYKTTGPGRIPLDYSVRFKSTGRGVLKGKWLLDGTVIGLFQAVLQDGHIARVDRSQLAVLPLGKPGIHRFTFVFSNYRTNMQIPIIRYFVSEDGEIGIVSPRSGSKSSTGNKVRLQWKLNRWKKKKDQRAGLDQDQYYEIAISEIPFQFLEDDDIQWKKVGHVTTYTVDTSNLKKWVYWQVRQKGPGGSVLTVSDVASFKIVQE